MVSFIGFLFIYILGGITFIPLLLFVYIKGEKEIVKANEEELEVTKDLQNDVVKKGWIRLINQYQPKMPDLSHSGIISGIQSYVNNSNNNSSNSEIKYKKGVFYGVLKHGTLFCFESEKQKEIMMILPMQDYQVSLFAPSIETKSDGELYSRTTVVQLVPNGYKTDISSASAVLKESICILPEEDITCHPSRVLYLTCARNIDKEDWYFGLIQAHQMLHDNPKVGPHYVMMDSTQFEPQAIEKLIQQVQSTPSQREMAWLNAILGRVFLSTYKTDQLRSYFESKIRNKIDKTRRPTFLDEIHVRSVDVGNAAPMITSPKLLSLSTDGEVIVEAKVEYRGGLTIEIETDFNWTYSSRMKPIRMHLVLAVTLKKLQGRLMLKLKAPPTNRFWLAFFEMPEMEWKITPVVADKQIKLNIVTNAIESRIREVMAESFVLPNMNDIAFSSSNGKGGIFGEYHKVRVKPKWESDGAESIKSQRTNSVQSSSSSNSSKSENKSNVIRENPSVPSSSERSHAMDALKLKNRGAESATNLLIDEPDSLIPPRTLEPSRSTPDMQPPMQELPAADTQSTNSSSKWSTSTYLRRRSKASTDESDNSDTDSIKSNSFLSKFTNLLPSEQSSDSMSVRSNTTTTKKQAIINMAENFLAKRNSRHEEDEKPVVTESKKEIYAQRMANLRERVKEKMGSGKLPNHPLPPSFPSKKADGEQVAASPGSNSPPTSTPPVKPRRGRANTTSSESSEKPPLPPRKHSIHTDRQSTLEPAKIKTEVADEKEGSQVVEDSIKEDSNTKLDEIEESNLTQENKSKGVIDLEENENKEDALSANNDKEKDLLKGDGIKEESVSKRDGIKEDSVAKGDNVKEDSVAKGDDVKEDGDIKGDGVKEDSVVKGVDEINIRKQDNLEEDGFAKEKDKKPVDQGDHVDIKLVYSPPPLPSTPRPKRASLIEEVDKEQAKPPIPPRSPNQKHIAPPVPPRSPNLSHANSPTVPPRPH